jgi:hypothetical protein
LLSAAGSLWFADVSAKSGVDWAKVIAAIPPIAGLLAGLVGWIRGRQRRGLASTNPPFGMLRLNTSKESPFGDQASIKQRQELMNFTKYGFLLALCSFPLAIYWSLSWGSSGWLTLALVVELLVLGFFGVRLWTQTWKKVPGEPIDRCAVECLVNGDFEPILKHCQAALLSLGAVNIHSAIAASPPTSARLVAGLRGWQADFPGGERLHIQVRLESPGVYSIRIESANFIPGFIRKHDNAGNVRRLIEQLA